MPHIEILNRYTKAILLSGEYDSLKQATEKEKVNLYEADLRGADLCRADLRGANLYEADLRGADLYEADLCRADLRGADLRGADLCRADLREANLYEADLRGADLRGANLREADLYEANGINPYRMTPLLILLDQPIGSTLRAYKLVNEKSEGYIIGGITYAIGKKVSVTDANTNSDDQCGTGINVATLDWCMREWQKGYKILLVEFTREEIACIPTATDGKFRLHACTPITEVDLVKIGLCS